MFQLPFPTFFCPWHWTPRNRAPSARNGASWPKSVAWDVPRSGSLGGVVKHWFQKDIYGIHHGILWDRYTVYYTYIYIL